MSRRFQLTQTTATQSLEGAHAQCDGVHMSIVDCPNRRPLLQGALNRKVDREVDPVFKYLAVTDVKTGITYANESTYEQCHPEEENHDGLERWNALVNTRQSLNLDELSAFLNNGTTSIRNSLLPYPHDKSHARLCIPETRIYCGEACNKNPSFFPNFPTDCADLIAKRKLHKDNNVTETMQETHSSTSLAPRHMQVERCYVTHSIISDYQISKSNSLTLVFDIRSKRKLIRTQDSREELGGWNQFICETTLEEPTCNLKASCSPGTVHFGSIYLGCEPPNGIVIMLTPNIETSMTTHSIQTELLKQLLHHNNLYYKTLEIEHLDIENAKGFGAILMTKPRFRESKTGEMTSGNVFKTAVEETMRCQAFMEGVNVTLCYVLLYPVPNITGIIRSYIEIPSEMVTCESVSNEDTSVQCGDTFSKSWSNNSRSGVTQATTKPFLQPLAILSSLFIFN